MAAIDPLTAGAVFIATAATDAVYVMFTSAVIARKRVPAANWSAVWYMLSSYAVISYTENAFYVAFAAIGSWAGRLRLTDIPAPPARRPAGGGGTRVRAAVSTRLSRAKRSNPESFRGGSLDCFVARAPRNDDVEAFGHLSKQLH
ncbi:hypothetical protein ACVWXM_000591 [Bradyrhizobium sp. GM7.3]